MDLWTLGVLTFVLLSGYHPFDEFGDLPESQVLKNVVASHFTFQV